MGDFERYFARIIYGMIAAALIAGIVIGLIIRSVV